MKKLFATMAFIAISTLAMMALPSVAMASTELTGTLSGDTHWVTGTNSEHATPYGLSENDQYLSTFGVGKFTFTNLSEKAGSIGFRWGSVDSFNTLDLFDKVGNVLQTFTHVGDGDQGPAGTIFQKIYFTPGTAGGLRFGSPQRAFEGGGVGGIVAGVPEPASWAMLIVGFGLVGVTLRRRVKNAVVA